MKKLFVICLAVALTACGGGSSGSGGGFSTLIGPTPFFGLWQVVATITVIVGGTTTNISHTTTLDVQPSGVVTVTDTDSDCALSVFAKDNRLLYQEECTLAAENAPCVIQFTTNAIFAGDNVSGAFGPDSFVCVGSSTSFSGNLIGARFDPGADDDNGNGNGNENGNENNNENTNNNGNS